MEHSEPKAAAPGLRILAILPGDDFSGPAGQVVSTAAALAQHGVEVRFALLCRPGQATGRIPAFLRRRGIAFEVVHDRGPLDLGVVWSVRQLLARWQPAIVETHGYKASAVAFLLRRARATWRWVGYFHGLTTETLRARVYHRLDLRMLAAADCAVAVSEAQRSRLLHSIARARVVSNAVTILDNDPAQAGNATLTDRLENAARPRIGVIGRLSPEKGVDVFLEALARLAERGERFQAVIAGDGPERERLASLSTFLQLDNRVAFLGHVSDMPRLYDAIDLLVIPSRSEGLPSVLLEALAADVPVVATRVGAVPEVLSIPDAGVLVEPDSVIALADGIRAALATLDNDSARRARAAAADAFSQERRALSLVSLYHDVLAQAQR